MYRCAYVYHDTPMSGSEASCRKSGGGPVQYQSRLHALDRRPLVNGCRQSLQRFFSIVPRHDCAVEWKRPGESSLSRLASVCFWSEFDGIVFGRISWNGAPSVPMVVQCTITRNPDCQASDNTAVQLMVKCFPTDFRRHPVKSWFLVALVALLAIGVACGSEETAPPVLESPVMEPTNSRATTTTVLTPAPEPTRTPEPDATNTPAPAAATSEPTATPTLAPTIAPSVMQDLTVRRVTEDSLTFEWEPPANSDVAPVDEYEVIRDVSLLPDQQQLVSETTFTDTGLTAGTEHSYRIRAIGVDGAKGAKSTS